jgi:hypothetical protein
VVLISRAHQLQLTVREVTPITATPRPVVSTGPVFTLCTTSTTSCQLDAVKVGHLSLTKTVEKGLPGMLREHVEFFNDDDDSPRRRRREKREEVRR